MVRKEDAREGRGRSCRPLLFDAAHLHAHVARFDDHRHTHRVERLLDAVANLHRQPLLYLKPPGEAFDYAGDFRQPRDVAVGDVGHVGAAVEGEHVVLAERIELDVLDQHHLLVLLAEGGRADDFQRVGLVALREERHRLGHPFGGLDESFARRVLAQQAQNLGVVVLEGFDSFDVETLLLDVSHLFHVFLLGLVHPLRAVPQRGAKVPYFLMECK